MAVGGRSDGQGPVRGKKTGPNPTDRAKPGTQRSVQTDQEEGPLAAVIAAANVYDAKLLEETLSAIVVERPAPEQQPQHLCLDKGYDNPTGRDAVAAHDYIPHIRRIGEEQTARKHKRHKPRR